MRVKLVAAHKRLVLFALIAATCASAYAARDSGIARRMLQIGTDVSSSLRLSHYATTLYMIREDPIFGVGFGNYKYRYLEAQITMKSDFPYGKQLPWTYTFWAHNEYLQFIAECGIPAFIIVLSLLFLWARQIYGFVRAVTKSLPEEFLWGLSIVILFAVSSFFERPFHQLEIGIWFPLGCAVMNACVSPDKPEPDESTRHKRESRKRNTSGGGWRGFLTALCITAFSLVGAALYIHGAIGQYALRQVRNELNNTNDVSALVRAYSSLVTAQKPLLTREEAQRVRSYLDVMYYAGMRNVNEAQNAVDRAFVYFLRHPTYETYIFVRKAATGLNRRDIMQRLADILPEQPVM
jgi:hypothetical protein